MTSPYNFDYSSVKPEEDYPVPAQDVDLEAMMTRWQVSSRNFIELTEEMKSLDSRPEEYWYAIGSRLRIIHDEQLYRKAGFNSFSGYCKSGQSYSRQHAYKLMKVTEYIDQQWAQATSPVAKSRVQRLFSIGFTKLFLLHRLPVETLDRLLKDGVELFRDGAESQRIPLEAATITELKHALQQSPISLSRIIATRGSQPVNLQTLLGIIVRQARSLVQLIEQCQKDADYSETVANNLQTIKQYGFLIAKEITTLNGPRERLNIALVTQKEFVTNKHRSNVVNY